MNKRFLSADDLLRDSYRLAKQVYDSGWQPTWVVGLWRGGAPVGVAVQEYLAWKGVPTEHTAIRTRAYKGIEQKFDRVRVDGFEYLVDHIDPEDRLLIVDDVLDSGGSIQAVLEELERDLGEAQPGEIRIACPWYKPTHNRTDRVPDYYLYETEDWLVFPHELIGLSLEEVARKPVSPLSVDT